MNPRGIVILPTMDGCPIPPVVTQRHWVTTNYLVIVMNPMCWDEIGVAFATLDLEVELSEA